MPSWPSWTVEEASAHTGYAEEYVRRLCRNGAIVCEKLSDKIWLINQDSMKEYLERQRANEDARTGPRRKGRL